MGYAERAKLLHREKIEQYLEDVYPQLQLAITKICETTKTILRPKINHYGPATIELESTDKTKTLWERLGFRNREKRIKRQLDYANTRIRDMGEEYNIVLYAVVSPIGAIIKLKIKDESKLEIRVWAPKDSLEPLTMEGRVK